MAYIKTIEIDEADGIVKQEYEKGIKRSGRVFNILKIMSQSPSALKESMRMYTAIMFGPSDLSRAQREMIAVVVSGITVLSTFNAATRADGSIRAEVPRFTVVT